MINKFKEMAKREDGFTLVELLVVILIIAILAAAAVAAFLSQQDKARQSSGEQALQTAYKAAKAESVFQDGKFFSARTTAGTQDLADAILAGEPGLDAVEVIASSGAASDNVGIVVGYGDSNDDLQLAIDPEGETAVQTLTVDDNGTPDTDE